MSYVFKPLSEVNSVDNVQDSDTVLIIQDGEVKQTAKDNVGGVGVVYFVTSGDYIRNGSNWATGTDATVDDIVAAYEKGHVRIFRMYNGDLTNVSNIAGYRMYNGTKRPYYYDGDSNEYIELS